MIPILHFRYEYSTKSTISADELEKEGIFMKKPGEVTLETEYEKVKNLDLDNWDSVRSKFLIHKINDINPLPAYLTTVFQFLVPRPWDETPQKNL